MKFSRSAINATFFATSIISLGIIIFNNVAQAITALQRDTHLMFPLTTAIFGALAYTSIAVHYKKTPLIGP